MQIEVLTLPYTDPLTGASYPNAVAYPASDQRDNLGFEVGLTWYFYLDAQHCADGHAPVGQHRVQVSRALMLSAAAQPLSVPTTQQQATFQLYVAMAMSVFDTDTGQKDASNQPIMASFFAGAVPTPLTVADTWGT